MTEKINIKDLLPLLKDGWVAMDKRGNWFWYLQKPSKCAGFWDGIEKWLCDFFDIEPADDWEKSLMRCGVQPDLKLEVGKFYRTRKGRKAIVARKDDDSEQPFAIVILDSDESYYVDKKGMYAFDGMTTPYDIISEWGE